MTPDSLPDSIHEPAPDPNPDQVDGSAAEVLDEVLAPAAAQASRPMTSVAADVAEADVAQPDVAGTDVAQPDVAEPDVAGTDLAQPDLAKADPSLDVVAIDVDIDQVDIAADEPRPEPDPVLVDAVTAARAAAVEVGGDDVGEHLGVSAEDAHAVTHAFAATLAGYRGWHWAVTVARSPESNVVTVDEVVLLPGQDALRAPQWVPWSQRVRAGDLGAGDLLPADPDDDRLVPSYFSDGDPAVTDSSEADRVQMLAVADELGLGRVRVLSREGRIEAAERWFEADFGPDAPMAKQAPAHCDTCGFLLAVRGSLGAAFGVCANELSAADAHVVSVEYGCGAHSEAGVDVSNRVESTGSLYDSGELVMEATDPTVGQDPAYIPVAVEPSSQ